MGSLRSTLWRLHGPAHEAIDVKPATLPLASHVTVDLRDASALASLLASDRPVVEGDRSGWVGLFSSDLLPEWYEDWTQGEAERWRQLRVHALEALARRFRDRDRYPEALAAALAAVAVDPLRETAHRELIKVHIAEGNPSEAIRAFDRYCHLLFAELEALRALGRTLPRGFSARDAGSITR
jgi:DNA-binding SARP family transcriptional activator